MTEQDREKKIAEIREWHDGGIEKFPPITVFEAFGVMLDELDRIQQEYAEERAAHNAHVAELCELEKENRKLREEREKLIEGLRYLMKELGKLSVKPENGTAIHAYKKMRNILKEIGVTVE